MAFKLSLKSAPLLKTLADDRKPNSLSSKLRQKRFAVFTKLVKNHCEKTKGLVRIIDVGGTPTVWERNLPLLKQLCPVTQVKVVVANIKDYRTSCIDINCVIANATKMNQFKDKEFDIVFSNSVIEHVGDFEAQKAMANEILRIGKVYFVQTPNFYFPIEPHFLFPFFQFFPLPLKVWLIRNFDLGWRRKAPTLDTALVLINSVKLLTKKQLISLFPQANLFEEKIFSLTKSFILYGESP
ncbi:methyltransferase domain-containing protein [Chroogloeocystis siderophila]|jgi:SAM-dependent methyltransferase|uniref:Methyltransferase type 11 n=1 Tax=Chroogloeocystis siderophila 5.2 s.c.1 TaxID=247279 RepID=A0A1U7HE26_9CHRO|nr:methyltransferase domain-containing protein [Chroogloeocystis siderophila]OKH21795.1 methyltransferase type 11 [Chroogloeocystis siderophila 5.2 s.c.1]